MIIDWAHFTPLASLGGGVLIGGAALLLMAFNGRIMGVSGILLGSLSRDAGTSNNRWRLMFLLGTVTAPALLILSGQEILIRPFTDGVWLLVAGFLVGLGTAIGSGCTSGHGICGLARFSPRSMVAVGVFMATAIITVAIMQRVVVGG